MSLTSVESASSSPSSTSPPISDVPPEEGQLPLRGVLGDLVFVEGVEDSYHAFMDECDASMLTTHFLAFICPMLD